MMNLVVTHHHIPAAFLRLSHSLQYFGQVIPAGIFPAAFSAFQSAAQARSRAYSACRPSAGFFTAAGADFGAAAGAAGTRVSLPQVFQPLLCILRHTPFQ